MIHFRHTGIYVYDLEKETDFYINVFNMHMICKNESDKNFLFDELFGMNDIEIKTSKLITDFGKNNGQGDMLELVQFMNRDQRKNSDFRPKKKDIYETGVTHLAFGVDDVESITNKLVKEGGEMVTHIFDMPNGNKCCFCKDPEENWIELIERSTEK